MKYLVVIPIVGYSEWTIEVDDDMDMESICHSLTTGSSELQPSGKNPIKDFILVEDLEDYNLPGDWPQSFEVEPF